MTKNKTNLYSKQTGLEIAVIGMACRFPGAKDIDEFWENLKNGKETISTFSDEELLKNGVSKDLLSNPNYIKAKGFVEDMEYFDNELFDYSPIEAMIMDPQLRIFQECSWKALEDAGYISNHKDYITGVYAGSMLNLEWLSKVHEYKDSNLQLLTLNFREYLTTQLSYKLNLRGPSLSILTACSTSLVTINRACKDLLTGDCDIALAGGVSLTLPQKNGYLYQEGMINSSSGHCKSFDSDADGTVFGDGAGVVVLKRYSDAVNDADHIYAVIKGSGINNDGNDKVGFTAPSFNGQAAVIKDTIYVSEIEVERISYVEAHGTGTNLGDPIELQALKTAFNTDKKEFCALGSVKTNIGHLNTAAGIAGFIKTVLALKHKQIPASLHFKNPNTKIDFKNSPFYVNTELKNWESNGHSRIAAVSSFGIGGTNAHIIVEEAPEKAKTSKGRAKQLLILSAKHETALLRNKENLIEYLKIDQATNIADIAYTLQVGRKNLEHKLALVCGSKEEAIEKLSKPNSKVYEGYSGGWNKKIVFMFPGQGSQYAGMGEAFYDNEKVFRQEVDRCLDILRKEMGEDVKVYLFPANEQEASNSDKINNTKYTQPLLFTIEYALAKQLMAWGIQPEAMIGHSLGEYVAACISGVFSLEDALKLVSQRSILMGELAKGTMLSVGLPEVKAREYLTENLSIAAVNSPDNCIVSGPSEDIKKLEDNLMQKGIFTKTLNTSHAFHSAMMEPILDDFRKVVKSIAINQPEIAYISNVSGKYINAAEVKKSEYWVEHLRNTVRYSDGIRELLKQDDKIYLEVGPGAVLSILGKQNDEDKNIPFISLLSDGKVKQDALESILEGIGRLWISGKEINWDKLYADEKRGRVPLPAYSFERKRFWDVVDEFDGKDSNSRNNQSTKGKQAIEDWFYMPSWKKGAPLVKTEESTIKTYLVFSDQSSFSKKLIEVLKEKNKDFVVVTTGNKYEKNEGYFTVPLSQKDGYLSLFHDLKNDDNIPDCIINLWNLTSSKSEIDINTNSQLDKSFYSLLYIAQAIQENNINSKIKLAIISNQLHKVYSSDSIVPEKATLTGPCKTIPQEMENISCFSIDIIIPTAQTKLEQEIALQLLLEVEMNNSKNYSVAYRDIDRWVQTYELLSLPHQSKDINNKLKDSGTYLITGGLGGIGLIIAEHIAQTVNAKLVLITNSHFPKKELWQEWILTHDTEDKISQRIISVEKLEKKAIEVLVIKADVSDLVQMEAAVEQAKNQFGTINGIVHAAGNPGIGMIQRKTKEVVEKVFKPKIHGLQVLEKCTKDFDLDFILLFSSTIAITGGIGQIDYCAANAFMDSFAQKNNDGKKVISINWDAWEEVGMAINTLSQINDINPPEQNPIQKESSIHPSITRVQTIKNSDKIYDLILAPKKHWFLSEHKINNLAVMPGTAFIDLVYSVLSKDFIGDKVEITELNIASPLMIGNEGTKKAQIKIKEENNKLRFEIKSISGTKNNGENIWQTHIIGIAKKLEGNAPEYEIANLKSKQGLKEFSIKEKTKNTGNREFGPRWNSIKKIYADNETVVGTIELDKSFTKDINKHGIHPALLDCVLLLSSHFMKNGESFPFMFQNIKVYKKIPERFTGFLQLKPTYEKENQQTEFNLKLIGEDNYCILEIGSFILKEMVTNSPKRIDKKELAFSINDFHKKINENAIKNIEGIEVFERILKQTIQPQIIVSTRPISVIIEESNSLGLSKILDDLKRIKKQTHLQKRPPLSNEYIAPENATEKKLAEIWQELLGIEGIGINDNFFELGGNSLLVAELYPKINEYYPDYFGIQDLFTHQTISSLNNVIAEKTVPVVENENIVVNRIEF